MDWLDIVCLFLHASQYLHKFYEDVDNEDEWIVRYCLFVSACVPVSTQVL